ncbi:response regulator [Streptomyces tsukubensis]|nr:response regulator [Streptomyces tsukubensis]
MPGAFGRVLVVDDNKVIRQLIRVNLELEGFEVVTAKDGVECLDIVHEVRPDVITLDVVMPRLDGLGAAARLRADPLTRDVPLAVISACTQSEVDSGVAAGVDVFLAKPFEPEELVRIVQQLVIRSRCRNHGGQRTEAVDDGVPDAFGDGGKGAGEAERAGRPQ